MTYCGGCGKEVTGRGAFCGECGTPVRPAGGPPEAQPDPTPPSDLGAPSDVAAPSVEPTGTSPVPAWLRSRGARIGSRVCLALALVCVGLIVGWAAGSDRSEVGAEPTSSPSGSAGPATSGDDLTMPDVRGLTGDQARQVLADVGIRADLVTLNAVPAAGEAGLVLVQDPVYGYPVEDRVTLAVSRAAKVPAVTGKSAATVLDELDELGAQVRTVSRYVPGVTPGDVAAIDPAPGTALPDEVTVTVAAEPDELPLARVESVESGCWSDEGSLNGTSYTDLLTCEADREAVVQTWVISRAAQRVQGVVGIPDSGSPGDRLTLEVLGDGAALTTVPAAYGTTARLDVPVAGVLRLTLRVRSATDDYATLGLGDLVLVGDQRRLARLDTW